jgi:trigger factor
MNITQENKDDLNALLRIQIQKEDYEKEVSDKLKDYKKTAQMPGFRKGMVPAGIISKMYRKPVLLDHLNKLVSESLTNYIRQENLNILGEPLSSPEHQKPLDLDEQEEFEFVFELGLAPPVDINLNKKIKIPHYTVKVDDKMIDDYASGYANRFGKFVPVESAGEEDILKGRLQSTGGEGLLLELATISIRQVADDDLKTRLIGSKVEDVFEFDPVKAFPNETDRAALLNVNKADLEKYTESLRFTVKETLTFQPAEMNEELFNLIFGENQVTSEEEFRERIRQTIVGDYMMDGDYKFFLDARDKIVDSLKVKLPEEFLKRWILETNEGKITMEEVEKDFGLFLKDLKWQMVKETIARENNITVTEEEVLEIAKEATLRQFRNYGMMNIPDAYLENYAKETLAKEEERRKLYDRKFHDKVVAFIKENVKLEEKELSPEKFADLFKESK